MDDGLILLDLADPLDVEYQLELGYDTFNVYRGALGVLRSIGQYTEDPLAVPDAARFCYETSGALYDSFALGPGKQDGGILIEAVDDHTRPLFLDREALAELGLRLAGEAIRHRGE